jgi:triacylglycerol lipase
VFPDRIVPKVNCYKALPLFVVLALCPPGVLAEQGEEARTGLPSCVVLLHGLFRSAMAMEPLKWQLEDAGFEVINTTYPSLSHPIQDLATMAVESGVSQCQERGLTRIHFLTHSLGGILVREYLNSGAIKGLGRVVMLGPPNQGSQVADTMNSFDLMEALIPAVGELGTGIDSIPVQLGPVSFELGVIAGTFNWRRKLPGFPDEAGDGTVTVAETVVPGMLDFLELPVSHTFMIWSSEVASQAIYFLRHGQFDRSAADN